MMTYKHSMTIQNNKLQGILHVVLLLLIVSSCSITEPIQKNETFQPEVATESHFKDIDWNNPAINYDNSTGILRITTPQSSQLKINDAIILPDSHEIRVISAAHMESGNVYFETEEGSIENLFIDQQFVLEFGHAPNDDTKSANTNVFSPESIEFVFAENPTPSDTKVGADEEWEFSFTKTQESLLLIQDGLSLNDLFVKADGFFTLSFDFGEQVDKGLKMGKLKSIDAQIYGSLDINAIVSILKANYKLSADIYELKKIKCKFYVYGIPIYVSIKPSLSLNAELSTLDVKLNEKFSIENHFDGSVGYSWKRDASNGDFRHAFKRENMIQPYDCSIRTYTFNMGVSVGIEFSLYKRLSFSIGVGPQYAYHNNHCVVDHYYEAYDNSSSIDWVASFGGDFSIIKHLDYALFDVTKTLDSSIISTLPKSISCQKYIGEQTTGDVQDICFAITGERMGRDCPVSGALVKINGAVGSIDNQYANSDSDGNVIIKYTMPKIPEDRVLAMLVDGKGSVIDSCTVILHNKDFDNVDDYVPTEDDCEIEYVCTTFPFLLGPEIQAGEQFCGRTIISHYEVADYTLPDGYQKRRIVFDGPIFTISSGAFMSAPISSLTIPNSCTSIEERAFVGSSLESIVVPDHVTTINTMAFYCSDLKSISLGRRLNKIESLAFSGCEKLQTDVYIPEYVTEIGRLVFSGCSNIPSIHVPSSLLQMWEKDNSDLVQKCDNAFEEFALGLDKSTRTEVFYY